MRTAFARLELAEALAVLAIFSIAVAFASRSAPTLNLRSYSFRIVPATAELESLAVGEIREVTFSVINDREAPLRLLPWGEPCGGLFVDADEMRLPPFGRGEFKVRVKQVTADERLHLKQFELATDDPKRPWVALPVRVPGGTRWN